MKKFELIIKNLESQKHTIKTLEFENNTDVYNYFKKFWSQEYFLLVSMNEIFEDANVTVGDAVEIINGIGDQNQNTTDHLVPFIGAQGIVTEINHDWEHPYLIRFEDDNLNIPEYLWKREHIRTI